ncbi:MAG: polysaccharide deacetylase family protein [Calditrichaceae bacterium]|nr:polysaccharide deacetylase family protein [Calditrichaceae bacterium]
MQISQIPIINYHKISPSFDIGITTRHPRQFENDLEILKSYKFNTITFRDITNDDSEISNPIIITFDDAYETIKTYALPIMQSFGYKGVIYPVTNFIGRYNDWDVQIGKFKFKHLDWKELKDIQEIGFEIGSHTQSHELLTQMSYERQFRELSQSKSALEDALGKEVCSVSYPFGRFNQETIQCAEKAGYKYGLASLYFKHIEENNRVYTLKRFNIYRFDTGNQFKMKIGIKNSQYIYYRDWLMQKGGLGTALLQSLRKRMNPNGIIKINP